MSWFQGQQMWQWKLFFWHTTHWSVLCIWMPADVKTHLTQRLTGIPESIISLLTASLSSELVQSLPLSTKCVMPSGLFKCWGLRVYYWWPLIVRCSLCGHTTHCTEKRKRKAFSNSRSCPSASGNNRSQGRRPAWPILAWLSVSGGDTSPLSAVPFEAEPALY